MIDPIELANRHMRPFKIKGDEIVPALCPFCQGGKHHDKDTFALNMKNLRYNCMRGSCGKSGTFYQLCKELGEVPEYKPSFHQMQPTKKSYKKPKTPIQEATDKVIEYVKRRQFTDETIKRWNISSDGKDNVVFPYHDVDGEIVFLKFRPARKIKQGEKKMWRETDTKPILFGMWLAEFDKPLVITAGEFDAMAFDQAGVPNSMSVPSGDNDFTWVDECWNFLEQFDTIILAGDNDDSGDIWQREMIAKFGKTRCLTTKMPDDCKDGNEMLAKHGAEAIRTMIQEASPIPISGIRDMADIEPEDPRKIPRILTGIQTLDNLTGGMLLGELTIITGRRGEGKSTVVSQILCNVVDAGHNSCVFSGELRADRFQYWMHLQLAGKEHIKGYKDKERKKVVNYVEKEKVKLMKDWYRGKVYLCDNEIVQDGMEQNSILDLFEYAARRFNCKFFVVDNLMTARFTTFDDSKFYRAQGNFVQSLAAFAKRFKAHVLLVAHPRKTGNKDGNKNISNDDISGTGEIPDRADNVWSLVRDIDHTDLTIGKCRMYGEAMGKKVPFKYDIATKRFYEELTPDMLNRSYGWEKLIQKDEQQSLQEIEYVVEF